MGRPTRESDITKLVGRRIAEARRARGWTQAQLAEAFDLEPRSFSAYETGARAPSLGLLVDLSKVLGVTLPYLLGQEEPPPFTESPRVAKLARLLEGLDDDRFDLAERLLREVARR